MKPSRWLLVGISVGTIALAADDASATQSWTSGISCVQNNLGAFVFGTLKQGRVVGSANASAYSTLFLDCPVPRVSSSHWLNVDVVVFNSHPSKLLVCRFHAVDWNGQSLDTWFGAASNGWWTLDFANQPVIHHPDALYTVECDIPEATFSNARVLGYWIQES